MYSILEFNPNKNVIIFNLLNEMENSSVVIYFFTENIMLKSIAVTYDRHWLIIAINRNGKNHFFDFYH